MMIARCPKCQTLCIGEQTLISHLKEAHAIVVNKVEDAQYYPGQWVEVAAPNMPKAKGTVSDWSETMIVVELIEPFHRIGETYTPQFVTLPKQYAVPLQDELPLRDREMLIDIALGAKDKEWFMALTSNREGS